MTTAEKPSQISGLAITSLITALTCISPVAIICGHMALSRIKKSGGQIGGFGLALAGTIIGYVFLVITIFSFIPILFVGARAWKKGSDRAACLMNQRAIEQVVINYQTAKGLKPGDPLNIQEAITANGGAPISTTCPAGNTLSISPTIPAEGGSAVTCPEHDLSTYSSSGE